MIKSGQKNVLRRWAPLLVIAIIAVVAGVVFSLNKTPPVAPSAPVAANEAALSAPDLRPDDMILGDPNAPVTIIEYASLSCPHCAEFHIQMLPKLKSEYIDQGKAKLVFRDFPLNKPALEAAVLARCMGPMRFFGIADALFRQQQTWVTEDSLNQLASFARTAGIDQATFDACQTEQTTKQTIIERMQEDQEEFGIDATPTFIVNGQKVQGVQSYEEFKAILDARLADIPTEG